MYCSVEIRSPVCKDQLIAFKMFELNLIQPRKEKIVATHANAGMSFFSPPPSGTPEDQDDHSSSARPFLKAPKMTVSFQAEHCKRQVEQTNNP